MDVCCFYESVYFLDRIVRRVREEMRLCMKGERPVILVADLSVRIAGQSDESRGERPLLLHGFL